MTGKNTFDVAIIGAGPSGSTCANALLMKDAGLKVCLVDKDSFPRPKVCGDGLGLGVYKILKALNLLDILIDKKPIKYLKLVSPSGRELFTDLSKVLNQDSIGFVIKREAFDDYLFKSAIDRGAHDYSNCHYKLSSFDGKYWISVILNRKNQKKTIRSKVLVGADGARSRVRKILGIKYNNKFHTGIAKRAYVNSDNFDKQTMEMDFLKELLPGYGWVFPVSESCLNIGVVIDVSMLKKKSLSLDCLFDKYISLLRSKYTLEIKADTKGSYILPYGTQSSALVSKQSALIGDAGSMINPMTGEGIFYGMYAGKLLAERISKSFNGTMPLESSLCLFEKEFRVKFNQHYKSNYMLKKMWKNKTWSDFVIKACRNDPGILGGGIELMMGEKPYFGLSAFFNLLIKGLL